MSYLKTLIHKNGNEYSNVHYYSCDITNDEICEMSGWYGNDKIHISENGMEILIEEWIKRNSLKCGVPIIIDHLFNRLTERIKPDRYISKQIRNKVLRRYKHKCAKCGSIEKLEIDHVKPISKGGLSEFKNLQVLCKSCNLKKSNK